MFSTCSYASSMGKMIQIRHVPAELHLRLKNRAAKSKTSLSDYLLAELKKIVSQPTLEEMSKRLERLPPVETSVSPAEMLRQERDRR